MLDDHKYSDLVKEMKEKIEKGFNKDDILIELEKRKISILDTIKLTRELFTDSLASAKELVSNHPAWIQISTSYEKFHDEVFEEMFKMNKDNKDNEKEDK